MRVITQWQPVGALWSIAHFESDARNPNVAKAGIHEVTGDILKSRAQVIAHGVSPNDNFGQGLALSLREQWPAMYKDFRHHAQLGGQESGGLWAWAGADGRRIVCLFTQEPPQGKGGHGGRATLQHVGHALRALRKLAKAEQFTSIALPRLATGGGELPWNDVAPLVRQHLGDLGVPVIVYSTYRAGVAADEGL
jgi:O-acetyl-ADP-ribose deacetylase (regulator of RNase III)